MCSTLSLMYHLPDQSGQTPLLKQPQIATWSTRAVEALFSFTWNFSVIIENWIHFDFDPHPCREFRVFASVSNGSYERGWQFLLHIYVTNVIFLRKIFLIHYWGDRAWIIMALSQEIVPIPQKSTFEANGECETQLMYQWMGTSFWSWKGGHSQAIFAGRGHRSCLSAAEHAFWSAQLLFWERSAELTLQ